MKVMVVDDNVIVRLGLRSVLNRIDAVDEVIEANDAFSALEASHTHSPETAQRLRWAIGQVMDTKAARR